MVPKEEINEFGLYKNYVNMGIFTWKPFDYISNTLPERIENHLYFAGHDYTFVGQYYDLLLKSNIDFERIEISLNERIKQKEERRIQREFLKTNSEKKIYRKTRSRSNPRSR